MVPEEEDNKHNMKNWYTMTVNDDNVIHEQRKNFKVTKFKNHSQLPAGKEKENQKSPTLS